MIKIRILKEDNNIKKISITGHSGYEEAGKDIVCAAVSSTAITTVNNILSLDKTIDYIESNGSLIIVVTKTDKVTQKLLNNMVSMLSELENDYKKYIQII
ncbi:MAG: ribosomal-processing cysteine protease Prp [Bacilli bacterium]|nr:ribosomal-processing cysteine protease Prp [Bacilli bacterium]MDD3304779.1 ribosomal-processing cysteine protease Prp [Bacilli bacterium]MDD4053801.1 ribosomal-processing cysteine protease Prp [Bacilli bacterium]MDD4411625.1 ribosomal-processing cysteine protease Prp [Bacilli bacterium]